MYWLELLTGEVFSYGLDNADQGVTSLQLQHPSVGAESSKL